MVALIKDQENFTKKTNLSSELKIVAIKKEYRYVKGWHIVFSIETQDMFISSKNFTRKTWSTFKNAVAALEKIHEEVYKPVFLCNPKLDISSIYYEKEYRFSSYPDDVVSYGKDIKTYYLNTLFG